MNPSAGQADPFWYEWYVGLEKVIEMLHPDTEIASVEFQARGIKGWDDVVVRFQAGAVHRYQVKHSRTGTNLTFGSLVQPEAGASLLSALFDAWKQLGDFRGSALFSLYTNREAGHQASTSDSGVTRPALGQFIAWLDSALNEHSCIAKIVPPIGWAGAWCEWLGQLKGSDAEQHGFLSALKIETGRDELPVFEDRLLGLLQENFATSRDRAIGLFQSLTHELRVWTTSRQNRPVEVEDVLQALALDSEALDESPPPPPAPFFESRARFLQEIISALTSGPKVVFLCGEPGAGKTSLVSNLSMRRMERSMSGLVGLRYFAYRPITVESPVIPADADKYIQPERLWYTLLSQLRRGLRGRLRNYRVPVRNELISWSDARGHVLRIADELGRELQHDFVIVIDGIDHAARASRYDARASKEFFNSLPGPDELAPLRIRLLLAGQPPTAYPQYPHWITIERPDVSRLDVGKLDDADIRLLLNATSPTLIQSCGDAAVRLVRNETGGNTLATVFATAESKHCRDLEEFQQRLGQRRLKDGLVQYYQGIWSHATGGDGPRDAALALASMFFAARERVTPRILATAFSTLGRSELVWQQSLDALEPLIINDPDGYRVRHNDVRVFLHSVLESSSQASRRAVMGMMFDYYTTGSPNRLAAHRSALHLAQESGRLHDWPKIYSLHWVFEAASLGLPYQEIQGECVVAVEQAMLLRDWNLMLQVACAAETLEAWDSSWNEVNASDSLKPSEKHEVAFLRAEGIVTPLDRWSVRELNEVLDDVSSLIGGANQARATALLTRWFGGMTRFQLLTKIGGLDGDGNSRDAFARQDPCLELIKRFGAVFRSAGFFLPKGKGVAPTKDGRPLVFDFEMGWVNASAPGSHAATMDEVFAGIPPKFYGTIAIAVENLADVGYWHLVSELLENAPLDRSHFSKPFMARAAWWSLRAGLGVQGNPWLDVLQQPRFGLEESNDHDVTCGTDVARSFGWLNVAWDSGTIGRKVYDALSSGRRGRSDSHYVAVYRAAAVLGRIASKLESRGREITAELVPDREIRQIVEALWSEEMHGGYHHFYHRRVAGALATELVADAVGLSEAHARALLEVAETVKGFVLDARKDSLWELYRRTGNTAKLKAWLEEWLGDEGSLWGPTASSRESTLDELQPLVEELGEFELFDRAKRRANWLRITHRSHKDHSFRSLYMWLKTLGECEPTSWRDLGVTVLSVRQAARDAGCDNEYGSEIEELIAFLAYRSGPDDYRRLLLAHENMRDGEDHFGCLHSRTIAGAMEFVESIEGLDTDLAVAIWCLVLGWVRWNDPYDVRRLCGLKETLLAKTGSVAKRRALEGILENISPGEMSREPSRDDGHDRSTRVKESDGRTPLDFIRDVEAGSVIQPTAALAVVKHLQFTRPANYATILAQTLSQVGTASQYSGSWCFDDRDGGTALREIAKLISDSQRWDLVKSATRGSGYGGWIQSVTDNLFDVLLARAAAEGPIALRSGVEAMCDMHEHWLRGGKKSESMPVATLPSVDEKTTWADTVETSLDIILGSHSAEVVTAGLQATHAWVTARPDRISILFQRMRGNDWKLRWWLTLAERWVTDSPDEIRKIRRELEAIAAERQLPLRLQAWLVLLRLSVAMGEAPSILPSNPKYQSDDTVQFAFPPLEILKTKERQMGSANFVDRFGAVETILRNVEAALHCDLSDIRTSVAHALLELPEPKKPMTFPAYLNAHGDTYCPQAEVDLALNDAFEKKFMKDPLPPNEVLKFAKGFLYSEDAWVVSQSPRPSREPSSWPDEKLLEPGYNDPTDLRALGHACLNLAVSSEVQEDEVVVAAKVTVYRNNEDFVFLLWYRETCDATDAVAAPSPRTTFCARTFPWWVNAAPGQRDLRGSRPLVHFVGSLNLLHNAGVSIAPDRLWGTQFGWWPVFNNPLQWTDGDGVVARFERIHGPLRRILQQGHFRQPLLERWLVKKSAWHAVSEEFVSPKMMTRIDSFPWRSGE